MVVNAIAVGVVVGGTGIGAFIEIIAEVILVIEKEKEG